MAPDDARARGGGGNTVVLATENPTRPFDQKRANCFCPFLESSTLSTRNESQINWKMARRLNFQPYLTVAVQRWLSDLQKAAREREGELNHPSSLYEACNGSRNGTASSDVIRGQRQRKSRNERRERVKNGSLCQCHAASYPKIGLREITQ